ncbi:hypothetical protein HBB16_10185 [Pseudonocardia sp. MCCB 268]|nr:hypothetical protein [Pseudonocardia cytotoxica]
MDEKVADESAPDGDELERPFYGFSLMLPAGRRSVHFVRWAPALRCAVPRARALRPRGSRLRRRRGARRARSRHAPVLPAGCTCPDGAWIPAHRGPWAGNLVQSTACPGRAAPSPSKPDSCATSQSRSASGPIRRCVA